MNKGQKILAAFFQLHRALQLNVDRRPPHHSPPIGHRSSSLSLSLLNVGLPLFSARPLFQFQALLKSWLRHCSSASINQSNKACWNTRVVDPLRVYT
ncbi:hypothetical protein P8452_01320 [Trifolium repens]|nr:hypothetical protein P8452_01320 [Trifolium repens]